VAGDSLNDIPDDLNSSVSFLPGATQTHAFLWQGGVMHDLGTLGGTYSGAYAINARGQVAGLSTINSIPNPDTGISTIDPFFWDGNRMVDLGSLGGTYGYAQSLNNRGQVIGNSNLPGDGFHRAFLWPGRDGKMIKLPTLGGTRSEAKAINIAGDVTGAARLPGDTLSHPVLWMNGRVIDLGVVPGDLCAEGMAINSRRQIVGFSNHDHCGGPHAHGFLWENGMLFDLNRLISNPTAITVFEGTFINERGEITGNAVTPEGNTHAVVLIPCDESHPNRDGCDYEDVDESVAAQASPAPQHNYPGNTHEAGNTHGRPLQRADFPSVRPH
jgi:probable HAF family extracellular repeat protein